MNDKLKRISIKLEGLITNYNTPQNVYTILIKNLYKTQTDYFKYLGPENIIKLTFLIFSYKNTGDFDLGEQMLNDSMFLGILYSEGVEYREPCEACSGDAQIDCTECDGTQEVNCDECDGMGEIPCDTCYGSGIDPDSEEEEECPDCSGAGNRTCWNCGGNETVDCRECDMGLINCQECDGIGEIETEEWIYNVEVIMTWDPEIIKNATETDNTLIPLMSYEEYVKSGNEYIIITNYHENNMEFKKGFKANEVYCFSYEDNPPLTFRHYGIDPSIQLRNLSNYGY